MTKLPVLRRPSHPKRFILVFTGEVVHVSLIKPGFSQFERGLVSFGFLGKLLTHVSGRKLKSMLMVFGFSWLDPCDLWMCIWSNPLVPLCYAMSGLFHLNWAPEGKSLVSQSGKKSLCFTTNI